MEQTENHIAIFSLKKKMCISKLVDLLNTIFNEIEKYVHAEEREEVW